ncbi:probable disease resistance protein RPP1 [Gastrolobium bilobum]|uniref:probable disease resistance protein RPP1 n=1 Tax=Gastrolobium bilobum TaxID=150636 RepID=UPI002AB2901F|nr:probable disease resistance protein RPP1 [Gastrolobium bilobum]
MAKEGAIAIHEPNYRYDVFLSFRGSDTRRTFTGNLYNALRLKRFKTFMDEGGLKSGDPIASSILEAVEDSRISIVVLSKYYAYSSWCLEELVKILDCRKEKNQLVLPIFYDVDPSDVRRQTGAYGEAMARHEDRSRKDSEKVRRWRSALSEVANLSGLQFRNGDGYEYELIQKIVEEVTRSLSRYDVFLSFCGEDTRYSFTGFLYDALHRAGFKTFMDEEGLEGGNEISQTLIQAIKKSRLSIVVLSENYAYSSWCLDELVEIIECMKAKNQLVWPIFYEVEQLDVSNQTKSYGDAMSSHETMFGKESEKVQKWRSALSEVSNLTGWHIQENKYEYEFIAKIVEKAIEVENQL